MLNIKEQFELKLRSQKIKLAQETLNELLKDPISLREFIDFAKTQLKDMLDDLTVGAYGVDPLTSLRERLKNLQKK